MTSTQSSPHLTSSPHLFFSTNQILSLKFRYYDFNYSEEALSPEDLQRWADADGFDLQHPPRPAYVPEKLQLIEVALPGENPTFMGFWGLFWGGFLGGAKTKAFG